MCVRLFVGMSAATRNPLKSECLRPDERGLFGAHLNTKLHPNCRALNVFSTAIWLLVVVVVVQRITKSAQRNKTLTLSHPPPPMPLRRDTPAESQMTDGFVWLSFSDRIHLACITISTSFKHCSGLRRRRDSAAHTHTHGLAHIRTHVDSYPEPTE